MRAACRACDAAPPGCRARSTAMRPTSASKSRPRRSSTAAIGVGERGAALHALRDARARRASASRTRPCPSRRRPRRARRSCPRRGAASRPRGPTSFMRDAARGGRRGEHAVRVDGDGAHGAARVFGMVLEEAAHLEAVLAEDLVHAAALVLPVGAARGRDGIVVAEAHTRAKRCAPSPASITWSVSSITLRATRIGFFTRCSAETAPKRAPRLSMTQASSSQKPSKLSTAPVPALKIGLSSSITTVAQTASSASRRRAAARGPPRPPRAGRRSRPARSPGASCRRRRGRSARWARVPSALRSRMCSSRSCFSVTGLGASTIRSWPRCVFGNAITSRIWSTPAIIATMRSRPKAMPPWGGAP